MPTVTEDLRDGMRSGVSEDGGATITRVFYFKDLVGSGVYRLLSAWDFVGTTMTGDGGGLVAIPGDNDRIIFRGKETFAKEFDLQPEGDADAVLTVNYRENDPNVFDGNGGVVIEAGTTYETDLTDFDGANMDKPLSQRKPMYVVYEAGSRGRPRDAIENEYPVRLPKLVSKAYRRYTKRINVDPGPLGEAYSTRTNKTTWKGYPPESVLCLSINGSNEGQGWKATADFAIDRVTFHRQVGRAVGRASDPNPGEPIALTAEDLANFNGIDEFRVQGQADFNLLPF